MPLLSPETTGIVVVSLLLVWLVLGAHIGVALGLAGFLGIYRSVGPDAAFAQMAAIPFGTTNSFALAVIPLFILMGSFATVSGITTELFRMAYVWLGALRGGLAMATVMSSAAFGAASGSTIVNAAVFTKMAMPEMARFGYDVRLNAGCIAAAGTLAALIPPSILMVVYAVITEQSIGKLLIAGIVPGILTAIIYCTGIYVLARMRPDLAPLADLKFTWADRFESLKGVYGIMIFFYRGGRYLWRLLPSHLCGCGGRFWGLPHCPGPSQVDAGLTHWCAQRSGGHHLGDFHHRGGRHVVCPLPHLFGPGDHTVQFHDWFGGRQIFLPAVLCGVVHHFGLFH